MTSKQIALAADLCKALAEIGSVRRSLAKKPGRYHDAVYLELAAADMIDGEGQGSDAYLYLPPAIGKEVIAAAEKIIRSHLTRLGVKNA